MVLRATNHGFANCGLRIAFFPNSILRDSHMDMPQIFLAFPRQNVYNRNSKMTKVVII